MGDFFVQAASSLVGVVVGGVITVLVARWQTLRTLDAEARLSSAQEFALACRARVEREQDRSATAGVLLLERLADFAAWLPSLPDVSADVPHLSEHAREKCHDAMQSLRRGMQTDLLSVSSPEVRGRYRTLVRLAYDVGWREVGKGNRVRQILDVQSYMRYVGFSLECVIDGKDLPAHLDPPVLDRADPEPWKAPFALPYWDDPADGS